MMYRRQLVLAAFWLLSGVAVAQEPSDPVREAILRDAQRYAECFLVLDLQCSGALYDVARLEAANRASMRPVPERPSGEAIDIDFGAAAAAAARNRNRRMEVAQPWPPFEMGNELFAFVPYFASYGAVHGFRSDQAGYFIASSRDDGETWRFILVNSWSTTVTPSIDRLIPGYVDGLRPPMLDFRMQESPFASSRLVRTVTRLFVPVDDAYAYVLELAFEQEFADPLVILVQYDNPADPDEPGLFRGSLQPGQRALQLQSLALRGFEWGKVYDVEIEGWSADMEDRKFRHREELLFQPNREVWLVELSKVTTP